jgi:glycosyltransferase involved in cell wall biosynthesis
LLATYGSAAFISDQLNAIKNQSVWQEAELILVANDPDDVERAVLDPFCSAWPGQVQLFLVSRESLYASWNRGIDAAKADLLAIANVDDLRAREGLETQVRSLEENPEALFCFGPYTIVKEFGGRAGRTISPPEFGAVEFTRSMHLGPFFIWRRRVNKPTLYFDEQFRSGGDFDFAIRLACLGSGIRVRDILGSYYDGGSGLSTGSALQPIERTAVELRYGIYDKIDYAYLPEATRYSIYHLFWNGDRHRVQQCVPEYESWLARRREQWFDDGVRNYPKRLVARVARQWVANMMNLSKRPRRKAGTEDSSAQ